MKGIEKWGREYCEQQKYRQSVVTAPNYLENGHVTNKASSRMWFGLYLAVGGKGK